MKIRVICAIVACVAGMMSTTSGQLHNPIGESLSIIIFMEHFYFVEFFSRMKNRMICAVVACVVGMMSTALSQHNPIGESCTFNLMSCLVFAIFFTYVEHINYNGKPILFR